MPPLIEAPDAGPTSVGVFGRVQGEVTVSALLTEVVSPQALVALTNQVSEPDGTFVAVHVDVCDVQRTPPKSCWTV